MKFSTLADYFNQIESESSRIKMTHLLGELLKQADADEVSIIINFSLGQLNPAYKGSQFNLAEKNLIKVIAQLAQVSETTVAELAKNKGDIGLVVESLSWEQNSQYSVTQVYKQLSDLQEITGTGSQQEKTDALVDLLTHLDPTSAKYVLRIIVSKLRLGFSDMTVIDALSWMYAGNKSLKGVIEDAYNICVDLAMIATLLKTKGPEALEHLHMQVGIPIRPAAAERLPDAHEIFKKLGPCVAEPKIDGFRLQVHLNKRGKHPQVSFFSRNLIDMSYMFPDLKDEIVQLPVDDIIFEGEAIVYDPATDTFLPFQETVKRKRKHGIDDAITQLPLKVFVFSIFYLNGKDLLSLTQQERREIVTKLFSSDKQATYQAIQEVAINSAEQLEQYFNECVSNGLEGIMVKRLDAIYQPGKRNFNWIKLKRTTIGQLEDSIDCVILGYYAGEGKRAEFGIGAFLVGVYNPTHDRFETIAKIGTGLSDQSWKDIKQLCDARAVDHMPKNVVVAKELTPDVWVDPSLVCEIKADELTISPLHTAHKTESHLGYALRFPRFIGLREDKSATQATTIAEINRLYKNQFKK